MESIIKAKVKASGESVNVISIFDGGKSYYERLDVCDTKPIRYSANELDFSDMLGETYEPTEEPTYTPDYWTRFEHQAAIAAMQGILSNYDLYKSVIRMGQLSEVARGYANELVEKYKENYK